MEIKGWFTMNGVHIPIMEGQSKAEAAKKYLKSKHGKDISRLSNKTSSKTYSESEINDALTRFSSNEYENIRKASNNEKVTEPHIDIQNRTVTQNDITDRYKNYANAIEQYINTSPKYEGNIYRGIQLTNKEGLAYFKNTKVGKEIDMKGISSWSTKESIAREFSERESSKNYHIVFSVKNKSGVEITDKSLSKREKEVLHSSKSKFKVKSIKETTKEKKDDYTGIVHGTIHYIDIKLEEK